MPRSLLIVAVVFALALSMSALTAAQSSTPAAGPGGKACAVMSGSPVAAPGASPTPPVSSAATSPKASPATAGCTVQIKNFAFNPASIEISVGTTVMWTNDDSTAHTVTGDNGEFDSGNVAPGKSFSHTFDKAGTYDYHCSIHASMKGMIVVK